ncbi:MAG: tetratricopeptide repeat protein, partial [Deltaproteobacteria bacterium]|nr:tetratricopeptide repeat protein [Deltaproteobacteria bacterium]
MAINKRKTLDNAQKFARKGAYEKAYKAFNEYLKAEPKDAKVRLDLGQAYLKGGKPEDAIDTFFKVATQWSKDGFDAKAVAVYKQILSLDAERSDIYEPLGELYQRLGLNNEAMRALQSGAEAYQKDGKQKQALALLRRVGALDPSNTTTRLKVAELLRKESLNDEAISEYEEIAAEFMRQSEVRGAVDTYQRVLELEPGRIDTLLNIAGILFDSGDSDGAQFHTMKVRELEPNNMDAAEFLCTVLEAKDDKQLLSDAYRAVADLYRERGDEEKSRDILQRYVTTDDMDCELSEDNGPPDLTDDLAPALGEGPALETDDTLSGIELETTQTGIELDTLEDELEEIVLDEPTTPKVVKQSKASVETQADAGESSIDVEQVLAEVSVYLRYGKTDKALGSLESLVQSHPENLDALEKLGEVYRDHQGDEAAAHQQWEKALSIAQAQDDLERVTTFQTLLGISGDDVSDEEDLSGSIEIELDDGEIELDVEDVELDEVEIEVNDDEIDLDGPEVEIDEIDLDDSDEDSSNEVTAEVELDDDSIDLDSNELSADAINLEAVSADEKEMDEYDKVDQAELSMTATGVPNLKADLELAEFYFQQDLIEEAEALYRQILEASPDHPQAMLRMGEIEAKKAGDGDSVVETAPAEEALETSGNFEVPTNLDEEVDQGSTQSKLVQELADDLACFEDEEEEEIDFEVAEDLDEEAAMGPRPDAVEVFDDPLASTQAAAENAAEEAKAVGLQIEALEKKRVAAMETAQAAAEAVAVEADRIAVEAAEEAERISAEASAEAERRMAEVTAIAEERRATAQAAAEKARASVASAQAAASQSISGIFQKSRDAEIAASAPPVAAPAANETSEAAFEPNFDLGDGGDLFDLRAELSGVIQGVEDGASISHISVDGESFAAVFSEFKQGVADLVDEGDFQTHYDLGIAYREMGLLEDAIGEFQTALNSTTASLDCLHMMGLCAIDLDRPSDAIAHFKQALSVPDLDTKQQTAVRYDLARAFQSQGSLSQALETFTQVSDSDADFCDVQE